MDTLATERCRGRADPAQQKAEAERIVAEGEMGVGKWKVKR